MLVEAAYFRPTFVC